MSELLPRMSRTTLAQLRQKCAHAVALPPPEILDAPEFVLQIGFGKFVRGFLADFLQRAFAAGDFRGRLLAVQRRPDQRIQNLREQDGLYTLVARGQVNGRVVEAKQIIGSISRALDAETAWPDVIKAVQHPQLKIITTNVSEGGLAANESDRLQNTPAAAFSGKLTQLLYHRFQALSGREAEIGVVPCELVENNGELVRHLVIEQARRWELKETFVSWLRNSLHVANTVVDRIVVGAPPAEQLRGEWEVLGYRDDLLNCAEPFYEFILEADDFIQRHLPLDRACSNLHYVDDLTPYRTRKVLILNGPHTALAALGWLIGVRTVLDAMQDPDLGALVDAMMFREVIPVLSLPDHMDLQAYAREVLDRFGNPFVRHELRAICLNCSVKAGTRIFPTVRRHMERFSQMPAGLVLGIAGVLLALRDPELQDTHAAYIRERWQQVKPQRFDSLRDFARNILSRQVEWSRETIDIEPVSAAVAQALADVEARGIRSVLGERLAQTSSSVAH
jgi:tagaturonate reductase